MSTASFKYKHGIFNQVLNLVWTTLCFAPILWFWMVTGIEIWFYLFLLIALIAGILPEKILNHFLLSSDRKLYEKLGIRNVRKFVQNGEGVKFLAGNRTNHLINNHSQAQQYLKTIAMYERFHWICFIFFLLTNIYCFFNGNVKLGLMILAANIIYNVSTILLQQYNKIRIKKIIS